MKNRIHRACFVRASTLSIVLAWNSESPANEVDLSAINRITDEALNHSEIPQLASHLTDRIGPRLTNSPQMREAERWTQERFRSWGLSDVRAEAFDFGRGWSFDDVSVRMVTPRVRVLRSIPVAWTPGTKGTVRGAVIIAPLEKESDFDRWRGSLRGKIVLIKRPPQVPATAEAVPRRLTDEELDQLDQYPVPTHSQAEEAKYAEQSEYEGKRDRFLAAEGALAWIVPSDSEGGLLNGHSYGYALTGFRTNGALEVPGIEVAREDYRQLARLLKSGAAPTLEVSSEVRFHDDDPRANNILADLPGRDPKSGYVMAGAHLDSWVASDGAQDNASGCIVVLEAARILAKLDIPTRRDIRFALWNAEEPGLLGSMAYVERNIAGRAPSTNPALEGLNPYFSRSWFNRWPLTLKPGHAALTVYFNVDGGSGKFRGIFAEGNLGAVPTLQKWLAPFASMGADRVVAQRTHGTDHVVFQAVGIAGFQFIHDPVSYGSAIYHTDIDSYDHLSIPDLKQNAIVLASVLLAAANAPQPLPRMPMPRPAPDTDPFAFPEDD